MNLQPPEPTRKALGDFQTPPGLVAAVLDRLAPIGGRYDRVLEPTCGRGAFLAGLLGQTDPPREVVGFEIQANHFEAARAVASRAPVGVRVAVERADVFQVNLAKIAWSGPGRLLVVGNLPWVTVAGLGAEGAAVPTTKVNHRRSRGIDAITGASNFDISEALWIKLIRDLAPQRPTIALLGKTAVARSLFRSIESMGLPVEAMTLVRIDAHRWFAASVDAGLLIAEVGPGPIAVEMPVHDALDAPSPRATVGRSGDHLIADVKEYNRVSYADGVCPFEWRQGVKHDAADVMELVSEDGVIRNKRGEAVDVEPEFLFPLLKGSDLAATDRPRPRRLVILPQSRLNQSTDRLEGDAPRLWAYLQGHGDDFDRRRSSIYRGRSRFALFGVGEYSFAPYKVAVSGLHKTPRFRVVGPVGGRPVLFDDTCYFLPFQALDEAEAIADRLNGRDATDLIRVLSFPDAKRPITKALLRRVDLEALRNPPTRPSDGVRDDQLLQPVLAEGIGLQHHLSR